MRTDGMAWRWSAQRSPATSARVTSGAVRPSRAELILKALFRSSAGRANIAQLDATNRSDIRELNELNFARFDAKLEQRLAELRAEMRTGFAELEARLERRLFAAWATLLIAIIGLWMRR